MYTIRWRKIVEHASSVTEELTIIFSSQIRTETYLLSNYDMLSSKSLQLVLSSHSSILRNLDRPDVCRRLGVW